ncbi:MAG: energy-coupled thiamine transporter ThiT [Clostridia bacterium]|nr:energy-coupled thiamine transporter ThiT [Clostridia bacterium]
MKQTKTKTLVECAILIAIATVLSLFKLLDLPYGGSITLGSMVPMILLSYRHGLGWGLGSGLAYGVIQQLLGLNTLSWVTTWQSILAVILLDYVVAFAVTGLGGVFRKAVKNQAAALSLGALLACLLRYVCHLISGCTVWAGLSIPTSAALVYSFGYNATYMIPETIVTLVATYYLGSVLDFRKEQPTRLERSQKSGNPIFGWVAGLIVVVGLVFDAVSIFSNLQNAETGDFMITGLAQVNWLAVGIVTVCCGAVAAVLMALKVKIKK